MVTIAIKFGNGQILVECPTFLELSITERVANGAGVFRKKPKTHHLSDFSCEFNVASLFASAQNSNLCYNDPQTVRYDSGDHFRHFGNFLLAFFLSGGTEYRVLKISKE